MGRLLIGTVYATLLGSGLAAQSLQDTFAQWVEAYAPYARLIDLDITPSAS